MPPKRGGGADRGRGRGRGGGAGRGGAVGGPQRNSGPSAPASHVTSVGVKRPSHGKSGKEMSIITNHFEMSLECPIIHHYDGRVTEELFQKLKRLHPQIFGESAYDGRKNLYCPTRLPFDGDIQEYQITLSPEPVPGAPPGKEPKMHRVRITKTHQEINPEVLRRYVIGQASHDNDVTVAINCLNVAVAMHPGENSKFSNNGKSFFVPTGAKNIGSGLSLWRGFFQSVRPTLSRMVINVDISTGLMYMEGNLLDVCKSFFRRSEQGFVCLTVPMREADRRNLSKFLDNVKIITSQSNSAESAMKPRGIKRILPTSSKLTTFKLKDGKEQTVQQYYETTYGKKLKFPDTVCVEVGSGAYLPLEICTIVGGQIRNSQPPPELTKEVVEFATKKPAERLGDIKKSLAILGYKQSPYLKAFGASVNDQPMKLTSRVLQPPVLTYAAQKQVAVGLGAGTWNMDKYRFFKPAAVKGWAIIVFAKPQFWPNGKIQEVAKAFAAACTDAGIGGFRGPGTDPIVDYADPQKSIADALKALGAKHMQSKRYLPSLILVILPTNSTQIYREVKYFGDVEFGVATQCMLETKCYKRLRDGTQGPADGQYYQNLSLKINVKLGGINVTPSLQSTANIIGDPREPTLIMGADAIHPAPGAEGRPSYTAVVGSVDTLCSKYVATCHAQTSGQEIIDDMEQMTSSILRDFIQYKAAAENKPGVLPKRIIMYRDGVSEGQFAHVIEHEIPKIKAACKAQNIDAKLTFVVVGKRHHVRFFPEGTTGSDRTGNCLAGTVVDQGISHPVEYDFYLQSHAGLLGTSRPAHYNVLLDENNMGPDSLQQLTYTLCHVYARSMRSVSIPAPTYYADIVCSRSANHYDPKGPFRPDAYDNASSGKQRLADAKTYYRQPHASSRTKMYFS
ncbi:hypothetical protein FRB94_001312 [Tulasnella sp. JGI-2019a]|nr:hypothetical protein FRB94_001312 [Tulasnella sp. JGI-2019a]